MPSCAPAATLVDAAELAVRRTGAEGERGAPVALSTHEAHNPMVVCPGQLGCLQQAIRVPLQHESFFFYTGRMPVPAPPRTPTWTPHP